MPHHRLFSGRERQVSHCCRRATSWCCVAWAFAAVGLVQVEAFAPGPVWVSRPISYTSGPHVRQKAELHMIADPLSSVADAVTTTYMHCLHQYTYPTQCVTAGTFAALGDGIAQTLEMKQAADKEEDTEFNKRHQSIEEGVLSSRNSSSIRPFSPSRNFIFFLKGLGGGALWATWFDVSDDLTVNMAQNYLGIHPHGDWLEPARIGLSILVEQFVFCPFVYSLWDIPFPVVMSGVLGAGSFGALGQLPAEIATKIGPLLLANAKVWTLVNVVTFSLAPQDRILFMSVANLVWQTVCSRLTAATPTTSTNTVEQEDVEDMIQYVAGHEELNNVLVSKQPNPAAEQPASSEAFCNENNDIGSVAPLTALAAVSSGSLPESPPSTNPSQQRRYYRHRR